MQIAYRTSFVPMAIVDDERRFVDANVAACLHLRQPVSVLRGTLLDDLVAPELLAELPETWDRLMADGVQSRLRAAPWGRDAAGVDYSASGAHPPGLHFCAWLPAEEEGTPQLAGRCRSASVRCCAWWPRGPRWRRSAHQLVISSNTVRTHLRNTRQKLGAASRAHAVALAYGTGLLAPSD